MKIGTMELIVIFLVIFFVLGPEKTVLYARKLGKWLRTLKVYIGSLTGELQETIVQPLQDIQEPLKDIAKPLEDLSSSLQQPVNELNSTLYALDHTNTAPQTPPAADETNAPQELEFAEMEEPQAEPITGENDTPPTAPAPEAHVYADIEDAGDAKGTTNAASVDPTTTADPDAKT